jgi:II/X family phage/plasmid replication protein
MCIKWLVKRLETILSVVLPPYDLWIVQRIDFAEVFNLGSDSAVKAWFKNMNNAEYTRRQNSVGRFGYTGLYFPGSSTTLKFYHKGSEFRKHDRTRCRKFLSFDNLERLQKIADCLLRIEVEIKSKKLKYDFGKLPFVKDISKEYLVNLFDNEVSKVLKLFKDDVKIARKADDVEKLLYEIYEDKPLLAGKLLGTWYRLSTKPETEVKKYIPESTLRRHKKLLLDAGCSWIGTDVIVTESECPLDFQPVRTDRHYFGHVLSEVQCLLEQIA